MQMDTAPWDCQFNFRIHMAACLIVGAEPVAKFNPVKEDLPAKAWWVLDRLVGAHIDWLLHRDKPETADHPKDRLLEGVPYHDGTLPDFALLVERARSAGIDWVQALRGELVSRAELHRWLGAVGIRSAYSFGTGPMVGDSPSDVAVPAAPLAFDALATRDELIDAFGSFTGMDQTWFANLNDAPALKKARRSVGRGGRNRAEPMFDPYEVMRWLILPGRKKGRPMRAATGWRRLRECFPTAYQLVEVGDPTRESTE
jgi:hypothetical protein